MSSLAPEQQARWLAGTQLPGKQFRNEDLFVCTRCDLPIRPVAVHDDGCFLRCVVCGGSAMDLKAGFACSVYGPSRERSSPFSRADMLRISRAYPALIGTDRCDRCGHDNLGPMGCLNCDLPDGLIYCRQCGALMAAPSRSRTTYPIPLLTETAMSKYLEIVRKGADAASLGDWAELDCISMAAGARRA